MREGVVMGATHIIGASGHLLDIPASGGLPVSQPGLSGGILQSVTTVGTAAVALTPLAGRATGLLRADRKNTATIYLGSSTVTADDAATGGMDLAPGESMPYPFSSAVIFYARSTAAGQLLRALEGAA